ncbi:MAG: type I restriction enzyme S subunit [Parasphingorhabdus sp.]|jgi:type I restriction enzyme S subunit
MRTTSIGEITEVVTKGTTPTSVGHQFQERGINFVKVESIRQDGTFIRNKLAKISDDCHAGLRRSQLHSGDILFSIAGALGRTAIVTDDILPANTNQAIAIIRLKESVQVDRRFVLYALSPSLMLDQVEKQKGGVAQQNLSLAQIKGFKIPLPPLEEQKRIVAVLDKAFADLDRAHALAEANVADAEELFKRELACAFARAEDCAEPRSFEKLCKALTPKTKIMRKNYLEEGDHPIVSQEADLISGYWNDESALMGLDEPVVVFGDHTRCMKYVDFDFVVGADGTKVLKPHDGIDPLYLYYGLRSIPIAEKGYARHFRFLKEASLPDLGEDQQRQLATGLQEVELKASQLRNEYEAKLDDIDNLRQSVLQKAFAGELT